MADVELFLVFWSLGMFWAGVLQSEALRDSDRRTWIEVVTPYLCFFAAILVPWIKVEAL